MKKLLSSLFKKVLLILGITIVLGNSLLQANSICYINYIKVYIQEYGSSEKILLLVSNNHYDKSYYKNFTPSNDFDLKINFNSLFNEKHFIKTSNDDNYIIFDKIKLYKNTLAHTSDNAKLYTSQIDKYNTVQLRYDTVYNTPKITFNNISNYASSNIHRELTLNCPEVSNDDYTSTNIPELFNILTWAPKSILNEIKAQKDKESSLQNKELEENYKKAQTIRDKQTNTKKTKEIDNEILIFQKMQDDIENKKLQEDKNNDDDDDDVDPSTLPTLDQVR